MGCNSLFLLFMLFLSAISSSMIEGSKLKDIYNGLLKV